MLELQRIIMLRDPADDCPAFPARGAGGDRAETGTGLQMRSEDITHDFQEISTQILNDSRAELCMDQHFLALALGSLRYAVNTQIKGIGTDGECLAVHPKCLADLYRENRRRVNRIYLHQVYHCLFRHVFKRIRQNRELWMLSCDMAVEYLIDSQNLRATRTGHSALRDRWKTELTRRFRVMNAESIYTALEELSLDASTVALLQAEFSPDDHSLWPSLRENERRQPPEKSLMLRKKWEDLSGRMQTEMESASVEASAHDSSLLERTQAENRERISYRSFLRKFAALREELHIDVDTYDSILYSLGLEMYGNMPLIEPVETREVRKIDEFVIVIDTSMSVSGKLVNSFLEQTFSVLSESESFLHKVNIRILMCDQQVLSDRKIESKKDLEDYMKHVQLIGEGGTDFRPAFAYVEELIRQKQFFSLRGLLYFTDGKGTYPGKKPPYETAFIFCGEDYDDSAVPPWAIRLILPAWQLEEEKRLEDERFVWMEDQV